MRWWARAHALPIVIFLSLIAPLLSFALASQDLLLPSFGPAPFAQVPLSQVMPLVALFGMTYGAWRAAAPETGVAARRLVMRDLVFVVASLILGCAVAALLSAFDWLGASTYARNLGGLGGLQMLAGVAIGYRLQATVPAVYVFLSALAGRGENGDAQLWAWPVGSADDSIYWVPATFLFVAGVSVMGFAGARLPHGLIGR